MKNENKLDEMVDIIQKVQQYAPMHSETKYLELHETGETEHLEVHFSHKVLLGDQLTVKRARSAKEQRCQEDQLLH